MSPQAVQNRDRRAAASETRHRAPASSDGVPDRHSSRCRAAKAIAQAAQAFSERRKVQWPRRMKSFLTFALYRRRGCDFRLCGPEGRRPRDRWRLCVRLCAQPTKVLGAGQLQFSNRPVSSGPDLQAEPIPAATYGSVDEKKRRSRKPEAPAVEAASSLRDLVTLPPRSGPVSASERAILERCNRDGRNWKHVRAKSIFARACSRPRKEG